MDYGALANTDELFVADLAQFEDGSRSLFVRAVNEPKHPRGVLTTRVYSGRMFSEALFGEYEALRKIYLEDDRQFDLDGHWSWMTDEERDYLDQDMVKALQTPGPPWINGIPPLLLPE